MGALVSELATPPAPQGRPAASVDAALAEPLIAAPDVKEALIRLNDLAGMDFTARAPSGHELVLDAEATGTGHDRGLRPKELLLVGLAGCTGMDVIAILRKKRQVVTDYRVRVAAVERAEHPKVYTEIVVEHVVSGSHIDPAAVARAIELSTTKYCPVSTMLAATCPIRHEFRIVEDPEM